MPVAIALTYKDTFINNKKLFGEPKSVTTCFHVAADEDFKKTDVQAGKDLDALGCLGDIGWYCLTVTLFTFSYHPPSQVQTQIGISDQASGDLYAVTQTTVRATGCDPETLIRIEPIWVERKMSTRAQQAQRSRVP
ncbi:hypothetical protein WJX73_004864 [Symbiochloris irregularis]|uniref:Uncharacterized protein n=1 Tax=Symbiochloris irregularis TaxID=706552 RepID=A0AAW1PV96_9CHLO